MTRGTESLDHKGEEMVCAVRIRTSGMGDELGWCGLPGRGWGWVPIEGAIVGVPGRGKGIQCLRRQQKFKLEVTDILRGV